MHWMHGLERSAARALSIESALQRARGIKRALAIEAAAVRHTSWLTKLSLWRHGYLSVAKKWYRLGNSKPPDDYLPDLPYLVHGPLINGEYAALLNDKLAFYHLLRPSDDILPRHYAMILQGRIRPLLGAPSLGDAATLTDLVRSFGQLVLKPIRGHSTRGVCFVEAHAGNILVNKQAYSSDELNELGHRLDRHLVCERVFSHPTIRAIAPMTTNCLRVLTLWEHTRAAPFVAHVAYRFGTENTYPADLMGVCAPVNPTTGRMGRAVFVPTLQPIDQHPDTGTRITDVAVPHWPQIRDRVLQLCHELPFLPQIGWDVAVTERGFKVLEGNNHPALKTHQMHGPMLADPRVRRFYEHHGVL